MINEPEDNLKGMLGKGSFAVPENYFEQLNRDIQTRLIEERLKAMTASPGFTVPELYFEQLSSRIELAVKPTPLQPTAKIVKLWRSDMMKYATAACFILLTAFGFYINNNTVNKPDVTTEMANEQLMFDVDEQLITEDIITKPVVPANTTVSEEDLEAYILNNFSTNDIAANY